jgi:alanine dehydrogenase
MRIGVPAETKPGETRTALTPAGARALAAAGHAVLVQSGAGAASGFPDQEYEQAGATVVRTAEEAWAADLVVKVKEPTRAELSRLRPGLVLLAYLHLAADPELAQALQHSGTTAVAYETITDRAGRLPLLAPMSVIAGRLAVQFGATFLEHVHGGSGTLLGGAPGVPPARVAVLGAGVVGTNAASVAVGMGAAATVLDVDPDRLAGTARTAAGNLRTVRADPAAIAAAVVAADLVVGAALVPGARAPRLVPEEVVAGMRPGSVLVDVSIDQGGCFATSRPTTHAEPTYVARQVVHSCVTNLPAAVPRTATAALTHATLPVVAAIAAGPLAALRADAGLRSGLAVHRGQLTHPGLAGLGPVADAAAVLGAGATMDRWRSSSALRSSSD